MKKLKAIHYMVLSCLLDAGRGIGAKDVAVWMGRSYASVYPLLEQLIKRGLATREKIDNRILYSIGSIRNPHARELQHPQVESDLDLTGLH